jgi:hypothetical protein
MLEFRWLDDESRTSEEIEGQNPDVDCPAWLLGD